MALLKGYFYLNAGEFFLKIAILKKRLFSVLFCGIQISFSNSLWSESALYKLACSKTNGVFSGLRCGVGWKFSPVLSENYVSDISGAFSLYKPRI